MTITEHLVKTIIRQILKNEDYRIDIVTLIDTVFLQLAIDFFKKIVEAKSNSKRARRDWYKQVFLDPGLPSKDLASNSGINMKTIFNMYGSSRKDIVINAASTHYDVLHKSIESLIDAENKFELNLKLRFDKHSVKLNAEETLIAINALAVKRAALRGGLWSTVGKKVEGPLMQTLCKLYKVPDENYTSEIDNSNHEESFAREVDFYLINNNEKYKCEVKLMGKGNPESADSVIARDSKVFVADTLSENNKKQLDDRGVEWVALKDENGFQKFATVLKRLGIPFKTINLTSLDQNISKAFSEIF